MEVLTSVDCAVVVVDATVEEVTTVSSGVVLVSSTCNVLVIISSTADVPAVVEVLTSVDCAVAVVDATVDEFTTVSSGVVVVSSTCNVMVENVEVTVVASSSVDSWDEVVELSPSSLALVVSSFDVVNALCVESSYFVDVKSSTLVAGLLDVLS